MDRRGRPDREDAKPETGEVRVNFLTRVERHVWRRVVSGFLVVVPLALTFLVFRFVVTYLDDILRPRFANTPLDFPGIGLVVILVALYLIGAIVSARLGRKAFDVQHAVLARVPVVKSVYGVARQATDALSTPMERQVNRVVFVEWPRPGYRALGFVTGYIPADDEHPTWVIVYVPTVPNPTSGNLAFVVEEEIIDTDISVEEAMKTVFSGGTIPPILRRGNLSRDPAEPDEN